MECGMRNRMQHFVYAGLAAWVLIGFMAGCSSAPPDQSSHLAQPARQQKSEMVGDEALPALRGEYSYVLAEVTEKNPETNSLEIAVLSWGLAEHPDLNRAVARGDIFNVGEFSEGATGTVSCSELALYPGGIQYGTAIVIAFKTADEAAFPLTAYSIEKLDWFEERLARAEDA